MNKEKKPADKLFLPMRDRYTCMYFIIQDSTYHGLLMFDTLVRLRLKTKQNKENPPLTSPIVQCITCQTGSRM